MWFHCTVRWVYRMHCESALTVGAHCILVSPPVYPFIGRIKNCRLAKHHGPRDICRISANYREIKTPWRL